MMHVAINITFIYAKPLNNLSDSSFVKELELRVVKNKIKAKIFSNDFNPL